LAEAGVEHLTVAVERDNANGRRFYEKAGFGEAREFTHQVPGCVLALVEYRRPILRTLLTGLAMGESPRWHEDRLWFSDWGAQEIVAVDPTATVRLSTTGRKYGRISGSNR
jgi:hypothetical protein